MKYFFFSAMAFVLIFIPSVVLGAVSIEYVYGPQTDINGNVVGTAQTIRGSNGEALSIIFFNPQGVETHRNIPPNSPISIEYEQYSNGMLQQIIETATGQVIDSNFIDSNGRINETQGIPVGGGSVHTGSGTSPISGSNNSISSDTTPQPRPAAVSRDTSNCTGTWYPGSGCGLVPSCYGNRELGGDGPYCQFYDLLQLVNNLIAFMVYLAAAVATLMFAYAGFLYVTASANPQNLEKAKNIFTKVLSGFVIILVAWLIIDIILSTLTGEGFSDWINVQPQEYETLPDPDPSSISTGGGTGASTCTDCENITAFSCKNPTSCQVPADVNQKLGTFKELLESDGKSLSNYIITETGVNTSVTHRSGSENLDLGCRGSGRNSDGTCTAAWVLSTGFWGGSRAVYETNSKADYDAKIAAGISPSRLLLLGTFNSSGTCSNPSGCISAPHVSLYP